jgi:hypothetical protein
MGFGRQIDNEPGAGAWEAAPDLFLLFRSFLHAPGCDQGSQGDRPVSVRNLTSHHDCSILARSADCMHR